MCQTSRRDSQKLDQKFKRYLTVFVCSAHALPLGRRRATGGSGCTVVDCDGDGIINGTRRKTVQNITTSNNIYTLSYPRIAYAESPSKIIIIIIQRLSSSTVLLSSLPCLCVCIYICMYVCIRCLMFTLYQSRGIFFLLSVSPPHT